MEEFVISRTFNAPRKQVWESFTDPEKLKHWWGPKGAKVIESKMDLRPGGKYHYGMETESGKMWGRFVFREIHPGSSLVFVNSFSDEKGGITRHPLNQHWPLELLSTFAFSDEGDGTRVTIRWSPLNPTPNEKKTFEEGADSMTQGWTGTMDRLDEYLRTKQLKKA